MKCSDFRNIQKLLRSSEIFSQRVLTHLAAVPFSQILAQFDNDNGFTEYVKLFIIKSRVALPVMFYVIMEG